jgi:hypothetical protein
MFSLDRDIEEIRAEYETWKPDMERMNKDPDGFDACYEQAAALVRKHSMLCLELSKVGRWTAEHQDKVRAIIEQANPLLDELVRRGGGNRDMWTMQLIQYTYREWEQVANDHYGGARAARRVKLICMPPSS